MSPQSPQSEHWVASNRCTQFFLSFNTIKFGQTATIEMYSCRSWDELSDEGSICSLPETTLQRKKLKERSLLAEIKSLRHSMVLMKGDIHMEAAGRVGVKTRIPYPRDNYGQGNAQARLKCPGNEIAVKASGDWEDLDLRSNTPSAASVEGCHGLEQSDKAVPEVCLDISTWPGQWKCHPMS